MFFFASFWCWGIFLQGMTGVSHFWRYGLNLSLASCSALGDDILISTYLTCNHAWAIPTGFQKLVVLLLFAGLIACLQDVVEHGQGPHLMLFLWGGMSLKSLAVNSITQSCQLPTDRNHSDAFRTSVSWIKRLCLCSGTFGIRVNMITRLWISRAWTNSWNSKSWRFCFM